MENRVCCNLWTPIYFLAITSLCRVLHMLQLRNCCVVLKNITLLDPLEFRWEQNEISIKFEFRGKYLKWNGPHVSSSLIPCLFTSLAIFSVHAQHTLNLFEHVVLGRVVDRHTCRNKVIITSKQRHCVVWRNNDIIATMGLTLAWADVIDGLVPWMTVIKCGGCQNDHQVMEYGVPCNYGNYGTPYFD